MAIRPINTVSFNTYNQVNFTAQKDKNHDSNSYRHTTSPLKAVPLAVMIAMSPLNTVEAQNPQQAYEIQNKEFVVDPSNKDPEKYDYYVMSFQSTDGNNSDAERIVLSHEKRINPNVAKLTVTNVTRIIDTGRSNENIRYIVFGPTITVTERIQNGKAVYEESNEHYHASRTAVIGSVTPAKYICNFVRTNSAMNNTKVQVVRITDSSQIYAIENNGFNSLNQETRDLLGIK